MGLQPAGNGFTRKGEFAMKKSMVVAALLALGG
jgi:hypothetical protein